LSPIIQPEIDMMKFAKFLLVIIFSGLIYPGYSQNKVLRDMINSVNTAKDDSVKVSLLISICDSLYRSKPEQAFQYGTTALDLAKKIKFRKGEAYALKYIGMTYFVKGDYVKAIDCFENSLAIFEEIDFKKGIANMLNSLGVIYNNYGDDAKALEFYLRSLKISEEINDSLRIIPALSNIGLIYSKKNQDVDKAKEYYLKALNIAESAKYYNGIGTITANLGELLFDKGDYKEALVYFESSLNAYKKIKSGNVPFSLNSIGKIYTRWKDYQNAIKYQEEALEIAKRSNSKLEMSQSMIALANTYLQKGDNHKALNYFKQSEKITEEIGVNYERLEAYKGMANTYSRAGDFLNAYKYQLKASVLNDTISSETNRAALNKLEAQLEFASVIKENSILKTEAILKDSKNRLQRLVIWLFVLGFTFISIFIILLVKANNSKKRANEKLNAALGIVNSQKLQIETAHEEIKASIRYAKSIQAAVLPKVDQIESTLGEFFILYQPAEIVSGDFYWISEKDGKTIIVAADCTGHGVPGAFMSMLGMTLLDEIINKENVTNPALILGSLRKEVISSLKQKGERKDQKEGMDITICTIDREIMKLQFAGAINPLYLIRNQGSEDPVRLMEEPNILESITEFKGDAMPIGISDNMHDFTCREIDIQKGDTFYMFTDGFPDQFGGVNHKKFSYKQFKEQLIRTNSITMTEQKSLLEKVLSEWMGNNNQTDDILVIGFRIN
jgi:serine phosphatase RsbU (regulator of sigma subunit)/Tfp pilus assembly protein PilF